MDTKGKILEGLELGRKVSFPLANPVGSVTYDKMPYADKVATFETIFSVSDGMNCLCEAGAGLKRLQKHVASVPFIIITAFTRKEDVMKGLNHDQRFKENRARNAKLVADFREQGLGGIRLKGHYMEDVKDADGNYVDDPGTGKTKLIPVNEESFFIPYYQEKSKLKDEKAFFKWGKYMAHTYNQDTFIFCSSDGTINAYTPEGVVDYSLGTNFDLDPSKMDEYWSKIHGTQFILDGYVLRSGFAGSTIRQMYGVLG